LQEKLRCHSFVALVGASGAGKSSVVRAGLLPRLRKETREPWEIVTIIPGNRPLYNLAAGFMPLLEPEKDENDLLIETGKQANAFLDGTLQIRDVVERILKKQPGTARFLLVVDQWEELYTLAKPESKAKHNDKEQPIPSENTQSKRFIDGLLDASEAGALTVVITLRGDFMGKAISYRPLSDRLQNAQINLGPMKPEELQQAIEEPARKVNIGFEPGLVDVMLTDVGDEPGNLPLLEFVLERLWNDEKRRGGMFRHQAYRDMNKLKGALAQKADDLYKNLSEQNRQQLRQILLQLVHTGENADYTRRRASLDDLGTNADILINQLTRERLLVSNQDKESGKNTLEVAHEALIRDWPQFQQWLNEDRDFLLWRERLRNAREEWLRSQDSEALLDGQRLLDARRWLKLKQEVLNEQEQSFIRRSITHLRWAALRTLSLIIVPLVMVVAFFMWSSNNGLSPKSGWGIVLAKAGILTLQPEMVVIPPDKDCQKQPCEFRMGSTESDLQANKNEQPQHPVRFSNPFKISRYEVTFDEYQVFAYLIASDDGCMDKHPVEAINDNGWGKSTRPAINVSWQDAQCYAQWLSKKTKKNYHLPTEAQWEYAARAGTTSDYYWGEGEAKDFAWFTENSDSKTHSVGELKPNAFGLYDMSGNVWEWVQDCWHENYDQAPGDGSPWQEQNNGDCTRRVQRGGSWYIYQVPLRSALRDGYDPDYRYSTTGFRLAQD
jgi:formylglycine-generating enzyme required for sulfatase activity